MAVDSASFAAAEADQLRRAGHGRQTLLGERKAIMARFFDSCATNGLDRELSMRIFE
ncbi:hypothetical protein ABJI51_25055 [Amycolatopsis sp. NEAU-NG30]|uniref:Uncharacterized protein n=1 Tax=Amycolatopsis melonis TaxID=3156488 RepID=A0ABV0LJ88_9PSEU